MPARLDAQYLGSDGSRLANLDPPWSTFFEGKVSENTKLSHLQQVDLYAKYFERSPTQWEAKEVRRASGRRAYPGEMSEMALAHAIGDKVEAAYRRGDMLEHPRKMMDDWAKFCATVAQSSADV